MAIGNRIIIAPDSSSAFEVSEMTNKLFRKIRGTVYNKFQSPILLANTFPPRYTAINHSFVEFISLSSGK